MVRQGRAYNCELLLGADDNKGTLVIAMYSVSQEN